MSYDLEKINKSIAECLSGSGTYEDLQRFRAEKTDILDREHFDKVQAVKDEISALEAQRQTDNATEKALQLDLEIAALEVDKQAEILLSAREAHGEINGKLFLLRISDDSNKQAIKEKKAELDTLIQNKITEQI
jgi:vacuolar-type H+-ATPase subunit I/STV1